MSIATSFKESGIGKFWLKYEKNIVFLVGIVLIAAVSFEAGYLQGQKNKNDGITINKVASSGASSKEDQFQNNSSSDQTTRSDPSVKKQPENQTTSKSNNQTCAYVASKNSNKYHLSTCQFAQKIKPENKICFSSAEEAIKMGYQGAKCCIK
jgi:hypothetical protein